MKISRSILALSLLAGVASPPLAAQFNPAQQQSTDFFKIVSGGTSGYGTYGAKFYSMPGQPVIDAWCVDFVHYAATSWDGVDITRFDSSDLSNTRFGVLGLDKYMKAAYLTQFFYSLTTLSQKMDLHYTIWHLFSPSAPTSYRAGETQWNNLLANGEWASLDKKYWFVVSDQSMNPARYGQPQTGGHQEFLVHSTPEPGTMVLLSTGLLGIFGVGQYRRRKQRQ